MWFALLELWEIEELQEESSLCCHPLVFGPWRRLSGSVCSAPPVSPVKAGAGGSADSERVPL